MSNKKLECFQFIRLYNKLSIATLWFFSNDVHPADNDTLLSELLFLICNRLVTFQSTKLHNLNREIMALAKAELYAPQHVSFVFPSVSSTYCWKLLLLLIFLKLFSRKCRNTHTHCISKRHQSKR